MESDWYILDIGCGRGEFGRICIDRGCTYIGIDFSREALRQAHKNASEAMLLLCDITTNTILIKNGKYDIITFIEFLEHIEEDRELVTFIPPNKYVFISVPSYGGRGHIRYFNSMKEVCLRYEDLIKITNSFVIRFRGSSAIFGVFGIRK